MSRLSFLARHPRRTLGALATVVAATGVAVGSGANFTSASANPTNTFTAGTLTQSNSADNAAVLTADKLKPGDSATGKVTITNTGNLAGSFTLTRSTTTNTAGPNGGLLSAVLNVTIQQVDANGATVGDPVYSGPLASMPTQTLGTFAPGAARTYRFTVAFPDGGVPASPTTGDNAYQGSSLTVRYDWTAAS
jgi:hypothetical protein